MNELVSHLHAIERKLANQWGDFDLFALFLRENAPGVWDLLVAAPWVKRGDGVALRKITSEIQDSLPMRELLSMSAVIIIDRDNPGLASLHELIDGREPPVELRDFLFYRQPVDRGFVFTCRPPATTSKPARTSSRRSKSRAPALA